MKTLLFTLAIFGLVLAGLSYPTTSLYANPNLQATATPISDKGGSPVQETVPTALVSPDRKWNARVSADATCATTTDGLIHEQFSLVDRETSATQVFAEQTRQCVGVGAFGLDGVLWSQNSRYFYFTDTRDGYPDGCGYWERMLSRLDTTTMEVIALGKSVISRDHQKIASLQQSELVIYHVETDEIGRFPLEKHDEMELFKIQWLPDSEGLLYIMTDSFCALSSTYSVVHIDIITSTQSILLE